MNIFIIGSISRTLSVIVVVLAVVSVLVFLAIRLLSEFKRPKAGLHSATGANFRTRRLQLQGSSRLHVVPTERAVRFNVLFIGAGVLVSGIGLLAIPIGETPVPPSPREWTIGIGLLSIGVTFCVIGILMFLLPWRFTFDKSSEQLIAGNSFVKHKYPLESVRSVRIKKGDPICRQDRTWDTHECLLIINGEQKNRLELGMWRDSDREATQEMSQQIADFIGVTVFRG